MTLGTGLLAWLSSPVIISLFSPKPIPGPESGRGRGRKRMPFFVLFGETEGMEVTRVPQVI